RQICSVCRLFHSLSAPPDALYRRRLPPRLLGLCPLCLQLRPVLGGLLHRLGLLPGGEALLAGPPTPHLSPAGPGGGDLSTLGALPAVDQGPEGLGGAGLPGAAGLTQGPSIPPRIKALVAPAPAPGRLIQVRR